MTAGGNRDTEQERNRDKGERQRKGPRKREITGKRVRGNRQVDRK